MLPECMSMSCSTPLKLPPAAGASLGVVSKHHERGYQPVEGQAGSSLKAFPDFNL